jgi:SAM-dependent methyltransferase
LTGHRFHFIRSFLAHCDLSTSSPEPFFPIKDALVASPVLHWTESGAACSARWRSERGAAAPKRVVLADDTLAADSAYRLACEGTGLLWRGDFQNARLLLQAMARRIDKPQKIKAKKSGSPVTGTAAPTPVVPPGQAFHLHRQAQAQRSRVLGMLLVNLDAQYRVALRRAPAVAQACEQAWGAPEGDDAGLSAISLRELLGVISAHEWRKTGVAIAALGSGPDNRIYPHYGVFSPLRGEYIGLVAAAPLPCQGRVQLGFDIGAGTGVLAAVLAGRGVKQVLATEQDPRALACARENIQRLGLGERVTVLAANLFPEGRAALVVCNPPWLPARPGAPIERAVYDEGSRMLLGFLNGLAAHLAPSGEGWLVLSDLAEHLGLRSRAELLKAVEDAGLKVLDRMDARPVHPKAFDPTDPLHAARAAEVTSLWRLAAI